MAVDVRYNRDSRCVEVRDSTAPALVTFWRGDRWEDDVWRPIVNGELPVLAVRVPVPNGGDGTRGRVRWNTQHEFNDAAWSEFEERIRSGEYAIESLIAATHPGKGKP